MNRAGFETNQLINGRVSIITLQNNTNNSGPQYGPPIGLLDLPRTEPIPWNDAPLAKTSIENGKIRIKVYIHPPGDNNRQYLSTVSNVVSVLGVHELMGHGILKYSENEHWKILSTQQNHWSWKSATKNLKELYNDLQRKRKEYRPH